MGHMVHRPQRMFRNVRYRTKSTAEVREAMVRKGTELRQHIAEREGRVKRLREEYDIDAERLAALVMRYQNDESFVSYQNQGAREGQQLIPAGIIANLVRESELIDSERSQLAKLELVLRNLRDEELYTEPRTGEIKQRAAIHELEDDELEYLGF